MIQFSEALIQGSTMLRWVGGTADDGEGGGCALGMAYRAIGGITANLFVDEEQWGWLSVHQKALITLPCGCEGPILIASGNLPFPVEVVRQCYASVLVHLFNYHVMKAKDWTFDRFVDWVKSVEPKAELVVEPEAETVVETVTA